MKKDNFKNMEFIVIGGTGSLGSTLVKKLLREYDVKGVRVYSRTEYLQWNLQNELEKECLNKNVSFLIGDIRDKDRLHRAMNNVDIVVNTAALKQIGSIENNPFEGVKTNIIGSQNIIDCAIDNKVKKVMHISTDKVCQPVNLYGATKMVAEGMFINGNVYTGGHNTLMSCCRYGNVIGSRGSVVELFKQQKKKGLVYITDERMTRFWITLDHVAQFIIDNIEIMQGEEIFIPKMPSMFITDLKEAVAPECDIKIIGIRKGEKLDETLISEYETIYLKEEQDKYILDFRHRQPKTNWSYTSANNKWWLTIEELRRMI